MGRPPKITGALREELWRRYKAGETILGIGRALDQRQKNACDSDCGSSLGLPATKSISDFRRALYILC
jgi:hypothetical protein